MIALARVDLPEPLGPINAWISPGLVTRLTPLRICLSSAWTWRLRISSSSMVPLDLLRTGWPDGSGRSGGSFVRRRGHADARQLAGLKIDQLGERRVRERLQDTDLDAR